MPFEYDAGWVLECVLNVLKSQFHGHCTDCAVQVCGVD